MKHESEAIPPTSVSHNRWRKRLACLGLFAAFLFGTLLVLREAFFSGPYLSPEEPHKAPILDMHCHAAGIGAGDSDNYVSPQMRNSFRFGIYLKAFGATLEELNREGDRLSVRRIAEGIAKSKRVGGAIVLAIDGVVDGNGMLDLGKSEVYIPNEFISLETAKYENLFFGASVNPGRQDALQRLESAKANGALLIKWLPSVQLIDPADQRHEPFYRKLVELDLPLLTHAGKERAFTRARDELADPVRLRLPLSLGVTVIVAHAASTGENEGQKDIDRLIDLLDEFPNLYADISSMTQVNKLGYLRQAIREPLFHGRLFYGSDFPLINTAAVSPWYHSLNLTGAQMREISAIENPWDQDVALKEALGVPEEVFAKPTEFFGVSLAEKE